MLKMKTDQNLNRIVKRTHPEEPATKNAATNAATASQAWLRNLPTHPLSTMVKYSVPQLAAKQLHNGKFVESPATVAKNRIPISFTSIIQVQRNLCAKDNKYDKDLSTTEEEMEHILRSFFPSYTWRQGKNVYTQHVSMEKGTNSNMANLAQLLSDKLYPEHPYPKFSISEQYVAFVMQAFDELNRQILLDKPLAGILLRQIRDYLLEEISNRRNLWMSLCACAGRKELHLSERILQVEHKRSELGVVKARLKGELEKLEGQLDGIKGAHTAISAEANLSFQHDVNSLTIEKRRQHIKLRQMTGLGA